MKQISENTEQNRSEGMVAVGVMNAPDGEIKGIVEYNNTWDRYQVYIGGSLYGEHKNPKDGIEELKDSGFKNVKVLKKNNKE